MKRIASIIIVLWTCKVFLSSIPYKFGNHPDTQHIFGTIGQWMKVTIGDTLGGLFSQYGAYVVGSAEWITSLILLTPIFLWILSRVGVTTAPNFSAFFRIGGVIASVIMAGAVFYPLITPFGVVVLHEGKSDGGSLFYAASSILMLGIVLFFLNRKTTAVWH